MDPVTRLLMQGAAGAAGGGGLGIEDVFSTWLYTGTGSTQTITNGIDLAGEGGLVWLKSRSAATSNFLIDTDRGATKWLTSNGTFGQSTDASSLTAFGSAGFDLGSSTNTNNSGSTYASWTFRKAPGFFDVVTYTGNGVAGRTISHNLGSVPGCIIVKRLNGADNWTVQHRSLGGTKSLYLNLTNSQDTSSTEWNNTNPTSSVFTVGTSGKTNALNDTYVAYLFAHDEQIFGDAGDQSVIKCGSYTGSASAVSVNLGWEPQWLLVKKATGAVSAFTNWAIFDNMRGVATGGSDIMLAPNLATQEGGTYMYPSTDLVDFNSTGFTVDPTASQYSVVNTSGDTFIYIAIRRGPMKTPTDATKVFAVNSTTAINTNITTNFPVDWGIVRSKTSASDGYNGSRLTGSGAYLLLNSTGAESAYAGGWAFDSNSVFKQNQIGTTPVTWMFRRAPGFFDVVAYTGTGVATQTIPHNLGVTPQLIIVKCRSNASTDWLVKPNQSTADYLYLNFSNAQAGPSTTIWSSTNQDATNFYVGPSAATGAVSRTFVAYLFATCPGVSKVGSYTGTGTTLNVDCGFTSGARFVLIKRTDSTGDWYVFDTARGITSSASPYLLLNSTAAEVTGIDYIDPLSSGFQITSTAPAAINASGGSFIFLAVA